MEPNLPPLEELESIRQRLVQQIEEAEQMFLDKGDGHELRTSKAALRCVEQTIKHIQDSRVA